jgi:nucleotide-binding universal stress UspA family protein
MSTTILLAVDVQHYAPEATELARELSQGTAGQVIALHVHEFATGRFGRLQVDCLDGQAEQLLPEITAQLAAAGVTARSEIRETRFGHVARAIATAAGEHDARLIVVGSSHHTGLPHLPLGSVSHRLLHLAQRPVLVVPRGPAGSAVPAPPAPAAASAGEPVAG